MIGKSGVQKVEGFNDSNTILFCENGAIGIGVVVGNTGVSAVNGKKILKAGTPMTGDLTARTTAFQKATTTAGKAGNLVVPDGGGTVELPEPKVSNAVGILMTDIDVTNGEANAQIYLYGIIDMNKVDSTTAALITAEVKTALAGRILFVK